MITLQKKFQYQGDLKQSPFTKVDLAVLFPTFDYTFSQLGAAGGVARKNISTERSELDHELSKNTYQFSLKTSDLIGTKNDAIIGFLIYSIDAYTHKNLDYLTLSVPVQYAAASTVVSLGSLQALYFVKSHKPEYYGMMMTLSKYSHEQPEFLFKGTVRIESAKVEQPEPSAIFNNWGPLWASYFEENIILINKDVYEALLPEFNTITNHGNNWTFFSVILRFASEIDFDPATPFSFDENSHALLVKNLQEEDIEGNDEVVNFFKKHFIELFDFPIVVPPIKSLAVAGTFQVKTPDNSSISKNDLNFYNLYLEYSGTDARNLVVPNIIHYDWNTSGTVVKENKTPFSFSGTRQIVLNGINGSISVSVKAFDGTLLWTKQYDPDDPTLKTLEIVVSQLKPLTLSSLSSEGSKNPSDTGKKIRGQVIEFTKKCPLKDLTVIIQAKKDGDELWHVVAAANTDASGNFSLPYPYGDYNKAQAIVSLTPNSPAEVTIKDLGDNEKIADDFLYLWISNPECPEDKKEHDCDCGTPIKAKRLPDQKDLIESDEYTQDIGGSCVNLSTPNRTLSEYNYQAIVRTSDPDVANYTLKKITETRSIFEIATSALVLGFEDKSPIKTRFELVPSKETIKRQPVGLNNPILWQDAPDNKDTLSLYQAVSIATGHILHYKAVTKADGYSLGDLLYSLALAPGQKKQIVVFDSSHTLKAAEAQQSTQIDSLSADIQADRNIDSFLGGGLNEFMQGSSSANTSGVSAGFGAAASYGGVIGASLGVAGGTSSSNSSASQNSSRNVSQYFGEKLRQSVIQKANDYRQLNSTVVTSVQENQKYAATTEVVANHNHCHALTMMYFEVLRHYAIYQELANVEECVFVPLLMTEFTVENIYKWNDVLARNLLPISSNTYLQPFSWLRIHPLLKAFDANERIKTNYAHVDFPAGRYCDENINSVSGKITFRVNIPRPKTRFDRILSLPIIRKTITTQGGVDVQGTIRDNLKDSVIGGLTGGLSLFFGGGPSIKYSVDTHEVLTKGKIFDAFMTLDENYESVRPAQCIRVHNFAPLPFSDGTNSGKYDFFESEPDDKKLWDAYASVLGIETIELLNKFSGNVISDWDKIFYDNIAPHIIKKLINESTIVPKPIGNLDLTNNNKYSGKEQLLTYNFTANTTKLRAEILEVDIFYNFNSAISLANRQTLVDYLTLNVENLTLNYSTPHYNGRMYSGYVGNDLLETVPPSPPVGSTPPPPKPAVTIQTPLNFDEKRNPRLEDIYIVDKLIEHLNSNLEYYNKILWYKLDRDRRYMLLDGFSIQIYKENGEPIPGSRSLASVVKNELITVAGNSMVFPVAAGYRVSQSYIVENTNEGEATKITLFDHYKPLTPIPPYRISVPSKGVFAEAIQGACDACEKEKEKSSQDWTKFTTDEPTPISPIVAPTPTITDWKAVWKDFAPPLINIQNAPNAPEPGAGLAGLSDLLGKSGIFKDITGLDANQQNVIRTYLSNQENAKAFAEMAKGLSMQGHNTDHSDKIMDTIKTAKDSGAINQEEYGKLVKAHIQKQIDGGDAQNKQDAQESKKLETSPIKSAVELAQSSNKDVSATESDSEGNTKTLDVKSKDGSASQKYNFIVPGTIDPIKQPTPNACWATVTTMMSNWKKQLSQSVDDYVKSIGAEYIPFIKTGITIEKLGNFCDAAGLKMASSNTEFPVSVYYDILQKNGPIWVIDLENDDPTMLHGRLLVGIKGDDSSDTTMFTIIDPATGSKYEENLPTFVKKMENVVKTLDAIKDVQIPLLIYYKEAYDHSANVSSGSSSAIIGVGAHTSASLVNLKPLHADEVGQTLISYEFKQFAIFVPEKVLLDARVDIRDVNVHIFFAAGGVQGEATSDYLLHGLRGASNKSNWVTIAVHGINGGSNPISEVEISECLLAVNIKGSPKSLRLSGHSRGTDSLVNSITSNKINSLTLIDRITFLDEAVEHDAAGAVKYNRIDTLKQKGIPAKKMTSYEVGNLSRNTTTGVSAHIPQATYIELGQNCMAAIGCVRLIMDAAKMHPEIQAKLDAKPKLKTLVNSLPLPPRGTFTTKAVAGKTDINQFCKDHKANITNITAKVGVQQESVLDFVNQNNLTSYFPGYTFAWGIAWHHFFVAEIAHELTD